MLILGALVLIVSIFVGEKLGDRVLLQTDTRVPIAGSGITPVPIVQATDHADASDWKRLQIVAVATDPGFPDPRVTRPPLPRVTPSPTPTASPSPTPRANANYTPPPLPLPLVSHTPVASETPVPDTTIPP
jgi:hypothetical protein